MRASLVYIFLAASALCAEEVIVDLRNPIYKNGILYTNQGGVIKNDDIRIQAQTIQYIRKNEGGKQVHRLEAEGNLLIQYKGKAFVGTEIEYDFEDRCGTVYNGKTFSSMWFVAGDQIDLKSDGSFKVKNVSITTCENKESSWDLHAGKVEIAKQELFEAKNIRFRLFQIPLFWLPSFKLNLKRFKEPIFRYNINWDKGQGPRAAIRYQLYSWEEFAVYGRVEYRWKTGWGGALETEYLPPNSNTTFVTRSYLGKDRLETAPDAMRRFRLQGAYHTKSTDEKTVASLTWDKYNDVRMPNLFKTDDFEVNTAKKTIFYLRHQEEDWLASFKARPRVNAFESIKQDFPSLYTTFLPKELGKTGIYNFFLFKGGYLDFAYSNQLTQSIQDFRSGRFELKDTVQRPIFLGPLTLTPFGGLHGILYTNSQSHTVKAIGFAEYGAKLFSRATRSYEHYKHVLEPHLCFSALTQPTVHSDEHYIFSIQDGYQKINQIQAGVRNLLFSRKRNGKEPSFSSDLYANAFFSDPTIPQFIPRLYLWLNWRLPSVSASWHNAWNFRHHRLEFSNARLDWTLSENVAVSFEGRYRSRFDWRKADHDNFILDVTRSETELLLSPLSDRRITFLTNLFLRLTPLWECHIQTHHGFYRLNEKPYNDIKIDLYTWISSAFKLRLSYSYIEKRDRFTLGLSLVKK